MTQTTTTSITANAEGRVVVQHSNPVGIQWLTPAQARALARALMHKADEAEAQGN